MIEVEKCTKIRQKFISFPKYLPDILGKYVIRIAQQKISENRNHGNDASQNTGALFFF